MDPSTQLLIVLLGLPLLGIAIGLLLPGLIERRRRIRDAEAQWAPYIQPPRRRRK